MKKQDNIVKKLWNKVKIEQWDKILKVTILCMVFMVLSEALFEIPVVADFFGEDLVKNQSGWMVYVIIWIISFLQCAIIPIPFLPILVACNSIPGLVGSNSSISGLFSFQTLGFLALTVSATVVGAICAYWLGRLVGKPAVKWVTGSTKGYETWVRKLNGKVGKWTYASTVLLPIFPDDLLCIVAGSAKINFTFFVLVNTICKFIGLFCLLFFMRLPGLDIFFNGDNTGFPLALTIYTIILIGAIITQVIVNNRIKNKQPKEVKLEVVKEKVLKKLNNYKSSTKELIIDYKLNKAFKTYLNSFVIIHSYYVVDETNTKQQIRIMIECRVSNYNQIIFDKTYSLTEKYQILVEDFKITKV